MYTDFAKGSVDIPKDHPRYDSLMTRERLVSFVKKGLVTPTGLVSHGRGEALDYLMGERTTEAALGAEMAAAAYMLNAKRPVVCVNGNAAALDAKRLIELADETNSKIEVNIFHRTEERMALLTEYLRSCGAKDVLGAKPDSRIPGLSSDRALCTAEGIHSSDVILVPIEDGDRAEALVNMNKVVIAIDLNPLSRTSRTATVSISDEMSRALANMISFAKELKDDKRKRDNIISRFSNADNRKATVDQIREHLISTMEKE
ncbi:MAG: phosphopantothenate/pantothenate synthetase [Methanomassiliicoccaceae archaeon]|jgi:4-phosphopantoate--beta-alanine ligase|nr:phosphopantothenate/pantothenate synthetase [Methanomassiliicoccaceae archaeon]